MMSYLNGTAINETAINDTMIEDFAVTNDDKLGVADQIFKWLESYAVKIVIICIILTLLGKCTYFILKFP